MEQKNEKIIERDGPQGKMKNLCNSNFKQLFCFDWRWIEGRRRSDGGGGGRGTEEIDKNKEGWWRKCKVKIIHLKRFYLLGQEAKWFSCSTARQQE